VLAVLLEQYKLPIMEMVFQVVLVETLHLEHIYLLMVVLMVYQELQAIEQVGMVVAH
jgi:hypothetical protein